MMKSTHMTVGLTITTVLAKVLNIQITIGFIAAALLGTILSDMDHPSGAINGKLLLVHNRIFKIITYVFIAITLLVYGPIYFDKYIVFYLVPPLIVIAFARHRSITHSALGLAGIILILFLVKSRYGVNIIFPLAVGMATHLLLDMFNPQGIELLWPNKKNYRFPLTITTNHIGEHVLLSAFTVCIVVMAFKYTPNFLHYNEIIKVLKQGGLKW